MHSPATPLPWSLRHDALIPHAVVWTIEPGIMIIEGSGGTPHGDTIDQQNAAYLIHAVNNYPKISASFMRLYQLVKETHPDLLTDEIEKSFDG